ncbi:maker739 [Drosophila busckii]|uniref:Maker739 n=1 Tax=Drosophila busckii TaxID=30019 RepID=A0A0M4EQL2_DROBS|nr:maker739 [Drosophila busckii]
MNGLVSLIFFVLLLNVLGIKSCPCPSPSPPEPPDSDEVTTTPPPPPPPPIVNRIRNNNIHNNANMIESDNNNSNRIAMVQDPMGVFSRRSAVKKRRGAKQKVKISVHV